MGHLLKPYNIPSKQFTYVLHIKVPVKGGEATRIWTVGQNLGQVEGNKEEKQKITWENVFILIYVY